MTSKQKKNYATLFFMLYNSVLFTKETLGKLEPKEKTLRTLEAEILLTVALKNSEWCWEEKCVPGSLERLRFYWNSRAGKRWQRSQYERRALGKIACQYQVDLDQIDEFFTKQAPKP